MNTKILFAFTLLCTAKNAFSQKPGKVLEWINTVESGNRNFYFEMPFEYRNNQIIIKVKIGKETYDYLFDTGGYNDITDAIQNKNNFPVLTTQTVGSSNRLKSKVNLVKVDSLNIGNLVVRNIAALQMNFDKVPTIKCSIDGGLIGASIIKPFIWQIDFSRKTIIVTDQLSRLPNLANAIKLPVTFNSRLMPFVEGSLDGHSEKFMFDLGSSSPFVLTQKTAVKYYAAKQVIEIENVATEGGNGVVRQKLNIFRADSFELGSIKFKNKPVAYSALSNENIIGNPIVKNFIVTMNFRDSEIYFTPVAGAGITDGWQSFGFKMEYQNGMVAVTSLFKGLAADKAGIKAGDEVAAIDGKALNCKDYCGCMIILNKALEAGGAIILTIKRDGIVRDVTLQKMKVF